MSPTQIRRATAEDATAIAEVHVASWRETYAGIVPQSHLDQLSVEARAKMWSGALTQPGKYIYVAEREGRIVGFSASGAAREPGFALAAELYAVYLLKSEQRTGIGRKLFTAAIPELVAQGWTSMYLWVLTDNGTRGFYERMGGEAFTTKEVQIGDVSLEETAYRWSDIRALLL